MPQSHTSTRQWQSFELRMRHRRVDRCVQRAREALAARRLREAREALDEAQLLDPDNADVTALVASLAEAGTRGESVRSRAWALRAAAGLILVAGALWWFAGVGPDESIPAGTLASLPAAHVAAPAQIEVPAMPPSGAPAPPDELPVADSAEPAESASTPPIAPSPQVAPAPQATPAPPEERRPAPSSERTLARAESAIGTAGADAADRPVAPVRPTDTGSGAARDAAAAPMDPAPSRATAAATPPAASSTAPEALPRPAVLSELPAMGLDLSPAVNASAEGPSAPAAPAAVATAPAAVTRESATAAHERLVRATLNRYQDAYSSLDAAAAGAIWPSVDRRALARAFEGLASQTVSLGHCDVQVRGTAASAECRGQARWTPKVGGGTQTAARRWRFELAQAGDAWVITQATVQ